MMIRTHHSLCFRFLLNEWRVGLSFAIWLMFAALVQGEPPDPFVKRPATRRFIPAVRYWKSSQVVDPSRDKTAGPALLLDLEEGTPDVFLGPGLPPVSVEPMLEPGTPGTGDKLAEPATPNEPAPPVIKPVAWYGLHVVASEKLLNQLVSRVTNDEGPIRDYILGAEVKGCQRTEGRIWVDLQPDQSQARFDLVLDGVTSSDTVGTTNLASVRTLGQLRFQARKEVLLSATKFRTRSPTVSVVANNQNVTAQTQLAPIPFLGPLGEQVALREADRQRPEAEEIARLKLANKILPQFNEQIDQQLVVANEQIEKEVRTVLKASDVLPDQEWTSSSQTHICYSAAFARDKEAIAGPLAAGTFPPRHALTIYVHESYVNNVLNRSPVKGVSVTDQQFNAVADKIFAFFQKSRGTKESDGPLDMTLPDANMILLAEENPLRFQFRDGAATLIMRAAFQSPDKDPTPLHVVTFPLTMVIEKNQVVMRAGRVTVVPDKPDPTERELIRAAVIRNNIEKNLPVRQLDRKIILPLGDNKSLTLTTQKIDAIDGWLIFAYD